jgi:hypothetical protein
MQASQTQIDAFHSLTSRQISDTHRRLIDTFGGDPRVTLTREELAARANMKVATVCGRVNELVKAGVLVVRGTAKRPGHRCKEQVLGLPQEVSA